MSSQRLSQASTASTPLPGAHFVLCWGISSVHAFLCTEHGFEISILNTANIFSEYDLRVKYYILFVALSDHHMLYLSWQ